MTLSLPLRDDPELGQVRQCSGCGEWWPFDAEFWHMEGDRLSSSWLAQCRACCADYYAKRRRVRQEIVRADRRLPEPVPGRCNVPMRVGRCGRLLGHDLAHRSTDAIIADRRRQMDRRTAVHA